jgi:hypothetical protein
MKICLMVKLLIWVKLIWKKKKLFHKNMTVFLKLIIIYSNLL